MELEQMFARIWDCLRVATGEGMPPFKALQMATVGLDGAPNVRTVELRGVNAEQGVVTFHTDLRSPKVAEVDHDPHTALVGINPERNLQIRLFGDARIIRDGPQRLEAWNGSRDHGLIQYRTTRAPGDRIAAPDDAFGDRRDVADARAGLAHFCVVEVSLRRMDLLDLSASDRPLRARFVREGARWSREWIVP